MGRQRERPGECAFPCLHCVELCVRPPPNPHHAHCAKTQSPCICTLALEAPSCLVGALTMCPPPPINLRHHSTLHPHLCTHSEPGCTATCGCACPSMFPFAWRNFHHKPALVAPIILWLEYFLCAHHTNFPNFQLPGTHADPPRPAFLPTWPFTACAPPCTPFRTPLHTSMHLHTPLHTLPHTSVHLRAPLCTSVHPCATFALHFPGLVTLIGPSILTSDPFGYPGQLSPSATGHNAHPRTSVESSPNSAAPIQPICFSLLACTTHIAIQGPCPAGSPFPNPHPFSLCKFFPLFWVTPGGLRGLGLKGGAVPPGVHLAIPPSPLMFPSTIMVTHTRNLPCMCNRGYIPTQGYVLTTRCLEGCLLDVVSMRGWVIG